MKYILSLLLLFSISHADFMKKKSLACPTIELITHAPRTSGESGLDITLYSIENDCIIVTKKDKIKAIEYVAKSKAIFQAVIYEKTGEKLYVHKEDMMIEQAGSDNIFKF